MLRGLAYFEEVVRMISQGRRAKIAPVAVALIVLAVAGCSGSSSPTSAAPATATPVVPSSGTTGGSGSLAGQTVTVWAAQDPFLTPLAPLVKAFEAKTGATVNFQILGNETAYYNKLQLTLAAHAGPDLWFAPTPLIGQYQQLGAGTLDSLLANSSKTPASWNYSDFPAGVRDQCNLNGATYCIPVVADTTMLYYNKAQFATAGISGPPQSIDELLADAAKLTTPQHAGFCMRAATDQSNYFTGQMMLLYFLPYNKANQGVFLDPNWKPQLATPQAIAMGNAFDTLETKDGPKGIAGYGYQECERDLNQGTVSMFWETSVFSADVLDPTKSSQASNIGVTVIPCPPSANGHCTMGSPWGIYMNSNTKVRDAAWQVMQYLTSEAVQGQVVATGQAGAAVRASVAASAFGGSNPLLPKDLGTALGYGFAHLDSHPFPPLPNLLELLTPFGQALSSVVSGQASVPNAFNAANTQVTQVLIRAGKLH